MTATIGILNLVLGMIYTSYGVLTALDVRANSRSRGLSHFGLAWIAMAFTCGPHHIVHGTHLLVEGRAAGLLELATLAIGYPAGVIWFLLRIEAFRGGRGDRFISGDPAWLRASSSVFAVALLGVIGFFAIPVMGAVATTPQLIPNLLLIPIYVMTGVYLGRGQMGNRAPLQGWSLSGLSLTVVFPTCALMHAAYAAQVADGTFSPDSHGLWVGWLAVPAGIYFLWVVRSLYLGTLSDWNRSVETITDDVHVATR